MTALEQLVQPRMEALELTQAELARRAEVSTSVLGDVLRGRARLTTPVALRLAAVLELDARQLLAAAPAVRLYGGSPR